MGVAGLGVGEGGPVLSVRALGRRFGRRQVLRDISFDLGTGAVLLVTGPNGAGKTTLLDVLASAAAPDSGDSLVCGIDAKDDPPSARAVTGYLPDTFPLYEELSPLENLRVVALLRGRSAGLKGLLDSLARCGLASRAEDPCKDLSAGLRRKVALAAATMHEPELLIMDEPLSAMDSGGKDLVLATLALRRDRKRGATVVAAHDPAALTPAITHRLALEDGSGEVRRVEVEGAVRSVDRGGAISFARRR